MRALFCSGGAHGLTPEMRLYDWVVQKRPLQNPNGPGPKQWSAEAGSDAPGLASSGSSMSADSRKLLTKNQKKEVACKCIQSQKD